MYDCQRKEENPTISTETEDAKNSSTMVAVAIETQAGPPPTPTGTEVSSKQPRSLLRMSGNAFKIDLKNFRPGGISLRKFSVTEAALLLIAGYLASRGLGLIRQTIFDALFGTNAQANAYYAASRLPETLFDLVAGGALSHAFIPVFISYEKDHGQREAWRLASLVFNLLLVALTILTLIAEFVAPAFVSHLLVPGYSPSEQALTTSLTRIMLLQPLFLGVGTVITAMLNSKRQFLLPALSLAVYNVGLIGGLLVTLAVPSVGIYGPTFGVIAAALCQIVVMIPGLIKQGVRYSFIWNLKHPGLREVLSLLGPNVLSVAIASTGFIVDTAFISYMPDKASLAAQRNAHLLFSVPQTLIALAIGTAALPLLTSLAMNGRFVRFRTNVIKLIAGAVALTILASLFLYVAGKPLIHLLYQHGAFGKHSSAVTGTALMGYAIALPGLVTAALLLVVFYAMKDALTPLFTNIVALGIRWGLIILLLRTLTGTHVILSIPLAAAGAGIGETIILGTVLYFRLRSKVQTDKGMQRLERWRNRASGMIIPAPPVGEDLEDEIGPEMVEEASIAELLLPTEALENVPDEPETAAAAEAEHVSVPDALETPTEVVNVDVPTTAQEATVETPETAANPPVEAAQSTDAAEQQNTSTAQPRPKRPRKSASNKPSQKRKNSPNNKEE